MASCQRTSGLSGYQGKGAVLSFFVLVIATLCLSVAGLPVDSRSKGVVNQRTMQPLNQVNRTASAEEWNQLMRFLQQYEHLAGEMNDPASMRFFEAQQRLSTDLGFGETASSGPCPGHMDEMCKPCHKLPDNFKPCGSWTSTCHKIFCAPLCLRLLWEVKVEAAGGSPEFQQAMESDMVKRGLEAYFLAYGCQDLLGCCPKGDMINNWAEQRVYQGMYPQPAGLATCINEPDRDKAKASCAIKVTVQPVANGCDKFVLPTTGAVNPHSKSAFGRAGVGAAGEVPGHKSFRERCEKLQEAVSGMAGSMQSSMEAVACACLGCDDSVKCPHRIMYSNIHKTTEEFESDLMSYKLDPADAKGGAD